MPAPFRLPKRLFIGGIITSASKTELRVIERGLLGVGSTGVIRFVEDLEKLAAGQKGVEEGEDQQKEGEGKHAGAGAGANLEANGLVKGVSENTIADEDRSATPVPEASSGGAAGGMTEQPNELQMPPPALPTKTTRIDEATQRENELIKKVVEANGWRVGDYKIVRLERGSFICSGFIDTHTVSGTLFLFWSRNGAETARVRRRIFARTALL